MLPQEILFETEKNVYLLKEISLLNLLGRSAKGNMDSSWKRMWESRTNSGLKWKQKVEDRWKIKRN